MSLPIATAQTLHFTLLPIVRIVQGVTCLIDAARDLIILNKHSSLRNSIRLKGRGGVYLDILLGLFIFGLFLPFVQMVFGTLLV